MLSALAEVFALSLFDVSTAFDLAEVSAGFVFWEVAAAFVLVGELVLTGFALLEVEEDYASAEGSDDLAFFSVVGFPSDSGGCLAIEFSDTIRLG